MPKKVMSEVVREDRFNVQAVLEDDAETLSQLAVMRSASGGVARVRVEGVGTIEVAYDQGVGLFDVVEGLRRVADAFDP